MGRTPPAGSRTGTPNRPRTAELAPRDMLAEIGMSNEEFHRIDFMYQKVGCVGSGLRK